MNHSLGYQAVSRRRYAQQRNQFRDDPRRFTRLRWMMLVMMVAVSGCIEGRQSTHELKHTTPAHWPANLNDAADKLDQRISSLDDAAAASELAEIISWIPEVAADSPLPEPLWSQLHSSCESLSAMGKLKSTDRSAYVTAVGQLSRQLRELHAGLPKPIQLADDVLADQPAEQ